MLGFYIVKDIFSANFLETTWYSFFEVFFLVIFDVKVWHATSPAVYVTVPISHNRGDTVRAQQLLNMSSCIFKMQLPQPVP